MSKAWIVAFLLSASARAGVPFDAAGLRDVLREMEPWKDLQGYSCGRPEADFFKKTQRAREVFLNFIESTGVEAPRGEVPVPPVPGFENILLEQFLLEHMALKMNRSWKSDHCRGIETSLRLLVAIHRSDSPLYGLEQYEGTLFVNYLHEGASPKLRIPCGNYLAQEATALETLAYRYVKDRAMGGGNYQNSEHGLSFFLIPVDKETELRTWVPFYENDEDYERKKMRLPPSYQFRHSDNLEIFQDKLARQPTKRLEARWATPGQCQPNSEKLLQEWARRFD